MTGPPGAGGAPAEPRPPTTSAAARQRTPGKPTPRGYGQRQGLGRLVGDPPEKGTGRRYMLSWLDVDRANLTTRYVEDNPLLRQLLARHGYKAERDIPVALGLSDAAVGHWLTGKRSPRLDHAVMLGRALAALTALDGSRAFEEVGE